MLKILSTEFAAGVALVLIGLFFIVHGGSTGRSATDAGASRTPAWLDHLIDWGIGLLCLWFGGALILGRARFY